jgi:hypothetical protein
MLKLITFLLKTIGPLQNYKTERKVYFEFIFKQRYGDYYRKNIACFALLNVYIVKIKQK